MNLRSLFFTLKTPLFIFVDYISRVVTKCNHAGTIYVFGSPRSGTTLLLEILSSLDGYRSIGEPFYDSRYPKVSKFKFNGRPVIPEEDNLPELKQFLEEIYENKLLTRAQGFHRLTFDTVKRKLFAPNVVVKFVRGNNIIRWIIKNMPQRMSFLIIRHPLATVSSQMRHNITSLLPNNVPITKDILLDYFQAMKSRIKRKSLARLISDCRSEDEFHAIVWCLDNLIILEDVKPKGLEFVVYEKLVKQPDVELQRIFKLLGEEVPPSARARLNLPSSSTFKLDEFDINNTLGSWQKNLNESQVDRILRITNAFGFSFYNQEVEPDYEAIENIFRSKRRIN